jgi:hypothetical protein
VRVPNPRLIRLGGVTRGAILEQGDGELIVTPVMQPVIELSSPIPRVFPNFLPAGIQEDSFFVTIRQTQLGVDPGFPAGTQIASLARGAWALECYAEMGLTLAAAQAAQHVGLTLQDPSGNIAPIMGRNWAGPSGVQTSTRVLHISFQVDAFLLMLTTPATAAGETLSVMLSINARRIL